MSTPEQVQELLNGPGLYLGTINILTALTRVAERPLYISYVGATWASGTV